MLRRVVRLALTLTVMIAVGRLAGAAMRADGRLKSPAGFVRGVLHGAMMPLALPTLLIGHDSTIYAERNTGRTYKLGYTIGINICGAAFFSFAFGSLRSLRGRRPESGFAGPPVSATSDPPASEIVARGRQ